jgi:hypothetical protein
MGASQAQGALVGILEGRATLLRPSGKLELAEGVALQPSDIVETAPASFVQIEFSDGLRLALGESSRLRLGPAAPPARATPRAHLLQGWMKLTSAPDKTIAGEFAWAFGAIEAFAGACVVMAEPKRFALFVESGHVALLERGGAARSLKAGEFLAGSGTALAVAAPRPTAEFVQRVPLLFRDALPSRAARFRDRPVQPRALGEVSYDDVSAWLQSEEGLRVALIDAWRVRLSDAQFRAAVLAHLALHPEWRPLVVPPPKKRAVRPAMAPASAAVTEVAAPPAARAASAPP